MKDRLVIVLEGERPVSWNAFYAGKKGRHWTQRADTTARAHQIVDTAIRDIDVEMTPYDCRVHITMRSYFKNRPLDPCNITAKLYIDGLHGWVIHDDTMEYVASVTTESHVDKENPRVEIEIVPEVHDG